MFLPMAASLVTTLLKRELHRNKKSVCTIWKTRIKSTQEDNRPACVYEPESQVLPSFRHVRQHKATTPLLPRTGIFPYLKTQHNFVVRPVWLYDLWVKHESRNLTLIIRERFVTHFYLNVIWLLTSTCRSHFFESMVICRRCLAQTEGMREDEGTWEDKKQDEGTWWEARGRLPLGRIGREQLERHWRWGPSL